MSTRHTPPSMIHGIARYRHTLSVSVHVDDVINSSARSMSTIRVLQSHGMSVSARQQVFHAVVNCHLEAYQSYASPAWWGFTASTDRQRIGLWTSAVTSDYPTFEDRAQQPTTNQNDILEPHITSISPTTIHRVRITTILPQTAFTLLSARDTPPIFLTV